MTLLSCILLLFSRLGAALLRKYVRIYGRAVVQKIKVVLRSAT